MLILPPSYPYGGMENPIINYGSQTTIDGGKSAAILVCHEVAHSWTGNYLTNSNWEDFWLNEGFTRYIEAKIMQRVYGDNEVKLYLKEGITQLK